MAGTDKGVALVTGAAGGMGGPICQRLVAEGWTVAGFDINDKGLDALQSGTPAGLSTYRVDQTNEADVRAAVAKVEAEVGPISALVNTTGWVAETRFETENSDYWNKVVAINYLGLLYVTHAVLGSMIPRRTGGRMVFIASDAGRVGMSTEAVYAGCKGAVIAFGKSIARENARNQISVNTICPGPTQTPLIDHIMEENPEVIERMKKMIPFRRLATPGDIAGAVSFLVGPDAGYITGQTLSISGGLTMV